MGISIKREETERLAREVAKLKGESLTDAIHHALQAELERLTPERPILDEIDAKLDAIFAEIDAYRGPDNGKSREEIEAEMYGEHGEPV
ncbi:MAG TPA: type II toxin-antitoxin system VapB family antitoxin [Caulobacteraceae bacterium]|nr:type II toxin-antitoxin system VapB family antitoxin [Caulobacteraceae bacterium]